MRILIGWDDTSQAETLNLFLNVDDAEAHCVTNSDELLRTATHDSRWDVVLLALGTPDIDTSFEVFNALRLLLPNVPIVGACGSDDLHRLPKFLKSGMRNYMLRDAGGDYIFLLHAVLFNAVEAMRAEREKELALKLREEISSVRKLQESIIPSDFSCPGGYDIAARYEPSQIQVFGGMPVVMAGGDYYEVFRVDENRTVVLVGDASGHGMKACMSIMTMHTLINMIRTQQYDNVASFVAAVNHRLCEQSFIQSGGGFITVFYGVVHSDKHEFHWTTAGHPIPFIINKQTGESAPLGPYEAGGLPLGLYSDAEYESHVTPIPEHSRLLIFTDGLPEAFGEIDGRHCEFGMQGMMDTLIRTRSQSAADALQALFDDSQEITQGAGRHDDSSVVIVDRL